MKHLSFVLLIAVSLWLSASAALAQVDPPLPNAGASSQTGLPEASIVSTQVSSSDDVALPSDGAWAEIRLTLTDAPQDARVHHVAVKYSTKGVEASQVSAKLGAQGASQTHTLQAGMMSSGKAYSDANIQAFKGNPVNQTWVLSMRGPEGTSGGYVDSVTLRVYFQAKIPLLRVKGNGTPGVPAMLKRPAGGGTPMRPPKPDTKTPGPASNRTPTRPEGTSPLGWEIIASETFEGAFPNGLWSAYGGTSDGLDIYWDDDDYRPYTDYWAAWPAKGGWDGLDPEFNTYPNNLYSWMVYGPFDLSNATDADTFFELWRNIETGWDWVFFGASADGSNFYGQMWDGYADWEFQDIYYTSFVGDSSVWIAWVFSSDGSVTYEGPWVDDVVIWKYTVPCYTLTTGINPGGGGSVTANPAPTCNNGTQYLSGTSVTLTANANSSFAFSNWSGNASGTANPITVTMDADKSITANFTTCYSLGVSASPPAGGSVTIGTAPNCSGSLYLAGTNVTLTANPNANFVFMGWSGSASGTTNPLIITMNTNKTIAANFTACYSLGVNASPSTGGSITIGTAPNCSGTLYLSGTTVALTANANTNFAFTGWSGSISGTANPISITMDTNKSITADFVITTFDNFDYAKAVGSMPYTDVQDTTGATISWDDPLLCRDTGEGQGSMTVWYKFTPSLSGTLSVTSMDSGYNTVIGIYTGARGALTRLACNDNANGTSQASASANVNAGTTYYIEIADWNVTLADGHNPGAETPQSGGYLKVKFEFGAVQTSVTVKNAWTTDSNGTSKGSFHRRDRIRCYADFYNSGKIAVTIDAKWETIGPLAICNWVGSLTIPKGTSRWYLNTKVPKKATYATYKLKVTATYFGISSSKSRKFSVVAGSASDPAGEEEGIVIPIPGGGWE